MPLIQKEAIYDPEMGDCQDYFSDGGSSSSSSSGTVKISALSKLKLMDAKPNSPSRIHSFSDPPYPSYLQQPLDEEQQLEAPQTPPRTPNIYSANVPSRGYAASCTPPRYVDKVPARTVRWNSRAEVYNPDDNAWRQMSRSLPDLRAAAYGSSDNTHSLPKISNRAADQMPLNDTIHRIRTWDTSVKLCTVVKMSQKGGIELHHHAELSVTIPKQDISATQVSICLDVINGVRRDHTCYLDCGQSSLFFEEDIPLRSPDRREAEINIIRDVCDMEKPLNVYLSFIYPMTEHGPEALLPAFRPTTGKVLSESVFIAEPDSPLIMRTSARGQYSTWRSTQQSTDRVMQFERMEMPSLYPEGLKDDLRIKIVEPSPIQYRAIGGFTAASVVWGLEIQVQRILGMKLECRMSLWLDIGVANILLSMDSHGWVPNFFLVDRRLATEAGGEWRQHEGHLILFKQPHMLPGPVKVEMNWQETDDVNCVHGDCADQILLPRIVDCEVLSGSFSCKNTGVASFSNPGVKDIPFACEDEADIWLPTLHKGYALYMKRVPDKSQSHHFSVIKSGEVPHDIDIESDIETNYKPQTDNIREVTRISHPSLRDLVLQIGFAFMVVIGLFIRLECMRRCPDYSEDMASKESTLPLVDKVDLYGHARAGLGLNEPMRLYGAGAAHDDNEGEGEGWRDWVDTALGWNGYAP